jgi:hypothetical protein
MATSVVLGLVADRQITRMFVYNFLDQERFRRE